MRAASTSSLRISRTGSIVDRAFVCEAVAGAIAAIVGGSAYGLAGELGGFAPAALPLVGWLPIIVSGALVSLLLFVGVSMLTRPAGNPPRSQRP